MKNEHRQKSSRLSEQIWRNKRAEQRIRENKEDGTKEGSQHWENNSQKADDETYKQKIKRMSRRVGENFIGLYQQGKM